ncbi:replication protein A2 [Cryptosporidium ryanae]|uniref:replication protein A2 n=1 Tax=Cryptosporidium ryanae TaxID=515981 RepID=UPI00351A1C8F|nr:replication protein A2 [Cryptosporidium ryanae]
MNFDGTSRGFGSYGMDDVNEGGGFMMEGSDLSMQNGLDRKQSANNDQRLAPLKVGMILRSYTEFVTLSRFQLFDRDINLFKLVGFVRNVEQEEYPQRLRFYLDDGSGLILIDWLVDNTGTRYKQELINSIQEGCFVKVFGELTLMVSEPSVRAFVVRPLVCTDEISMHDIDVATFIVHNLYSKSTVDKVQIRNTVPINSTEIVKESNQSIVSSMFNLNGQFGSGNSNNALNGSYSSNEQNIPENKQKTIKVVSAISSNKPTATGISNPLKLREAICSILEQASTQGNPEMNIDNIIDSLITKDINVNQEEIRNQLKFLVSEARVFQTNPHTWRATGY